MSKIFNLYENDVDKTWYDSSNVVYTECDDIDNSLKVLRIFFKNGRVYQYTNIDVNDYLLFREDVSQGKAFTRIIKKYPCERLDDVDIQSIIDKLIALQESNSSVNITNLIEKFGELITTVKSLKSSIKKENATEKQLAVLMHYINEISKELVLTEFSNENINLVNIKELWDSNEALVRTDDLTQEEINNIITQKLLSDE